MRDAWSVAVLLSLHPSLRELAADEQLSLQASADLRELLDTAGLPGAARCAVEVADEQRAWGTVTLNGRTYGAPAPVLSRIRDLVHAGHDRPHGDGTVPGAETAWLLDLVEHGGARGREDAVRFCTHAVRTIVTRHLHTLSDEHAAESLRQRTGASLPATEVAAVLREVWRARLSVRSSDVVVDALDAADLTVADRVEALVERLRPSTVAVHVSPGYLRELTERAGSEACGLLGYVRQGLLDELGVLVPPVVLQRDDAVPERAFAVQVNHVTGIPFAGLSPDELLVNEVRHRAEEAGFTVRREVLNPASDLPNVVVPSADHGRAVEGGLTVWTPLGFLTLAVAAVLRENAACFVDRPSVERRLADTEVVAPALVRQAGALVDSAELARVVRGLLREGIPVKELRGVLELLLDARLEPPQDLLASVRAGSRRLIAARLGGRFRTVPAYLLDPSIEAALRAVPPPEGTAEQLLAALDDEVRLLGPGVPVPALLTQADVRVSVRGIVAAEHPRMHVIAYDEVPGDFDIQPVARLGAPAQPVRPTAGSTGSSR